MTPPGEGIGVAGLGTHNSTPSASLVARTCVWRWTAPILYSQPSVAAAISVLSCSLHCNLFGMFRAFLFCRVCDLHHFLHAETLAKVTLEHFVGRGMRPASAPTWRSSPSARSLPPNSAERREKRGTGKTRTSHGPAAGPPFTFVAWWSPESRSSRTTFPRVTYFAPSPSPTLSLSLSVYHCVGSVGLHKVLGYAARAYRAVKALGSGSDSARMTEGLYAPHPFADKSRQ